MSKSEDHTDEGHTVWTTPYGPHRMDHTVTNSNVGVEQ